MLKILSSRIFWGLILVIGGSLLLLDTFGIMKGNELFWTVILALAGILFLVVYFSNRDNWWALIPGVIFLAISAAVGLDAFVPGFQEVNLVGPVILLGISLSFFLVYFAERSNWWAIIPAGVMATIALVAILDSNTSNGGSAGVFFLGLGITFVLVATLPNSIGQMRWAWIPASILGLMGVLILIAAEKMMNYIWPAALIVAGFILLWRSLVAKRK